VGELREKYGVSRRTVLIAAAGAAPLLRLMTNEAEAGARVPQSSVHYRPSPKDGQDCDDCATISSRPVGASWSTATSLATVGAGCGSRKSARIDRTPRRICAVLHMPNRRGHRMSHNSTFLRISRSRRVLGRGCPPALPEGGPKGPDGVRKAGMT